MTTPTDKQIIAQAKAQCFDFDKPAIDDFATVMRDEDGHGAFVQAWVWVDFADMREET